MYEITCSIARSLVPPGSRWEGRSELGEGRGDRNKKEEEEEEEEEKEEDEERQNEEERR